MKLEQDKNFGNINEFRGTDHSFAPNIFALSVSLPHIILKVAVGAHFILKVAVGGCFSRIYADYKKSSTYLL